MSGKSTNPPTPRVFVYGAQLGLLVLCSCDRLELFDLLALRSDAEPSAAHGATHGASWALAAQELRRILSEESMLKVVPWTRTGGKGGARGVGRERERVSSGWSRFVCLCLLFRTCWRNLQDPPSCDMKPMVRNVGT